MSDKDRSHLSSIELRLLHEKNRLAEAKNDKERLFREMQVKQIEKELAHEKNFLGIEDANDFTVTDEDLLRELMED